MKENTKTTTAETTERTDYMNFPAPLKLYKELQKVDAQIAGVFSIFLREKCVFCKNTSKCTERKKRFETEDIAKAQHWMSICDNFLIDYDLCNMLIRQALKEHPEEREDAITCDTTAEIDIDETES